MALADALLSCDFPGTCFAAIHGRAVWWMLCHRVYFELGGCFATTPLLRRILCRCGRAFRWMVRHHFMLHAYSPLVFLATFYPLGASSALRVAFVCVARLECPPPPCFFCCLSVVLWLQSRVCLSVLFFSVSICLVLCALVLVKLYLITSSFVSLSTDFFIMKNIPRHCRKKKNTLVSDIMRSKL